jgi:hypothetical protein
MGRGDGMRLRRSAHDLAAAPPPPHPDDAALLVQAERALLDMARRLAMHTQHADACATARAIAERLRDRAAVAPAPAGTVEK